MSSADLAIIGMAVVSLASIGRDYKVHMKVADRLRLVNPPKAPAEPKGEAQAAAPEAPAAEPETAPIAVGRFG